MKFIILFIAFNLFANDPVPLINQYRTLSKQFKKITGHNTSRIKDIAARRFINLPDWQEHLNESPIINPAQVYHPMPDTWEHWQRTAFHLVDKFAKGKKPLSMKQIKHWHKGSLSGKLNDGVKAGELKLSLNYGANFLQAWALTNKQISNIQNFKFSDGVSKLHWTDLKCKEDLEMQGNDISKNYDLREHTKSCQELYETSLKYYKKDELWLEAKEKLEKNDLFSDRNPKWARWFWFACWPRSKSKKTSFFQKFQDLFTATRTIAEEKKRCGMVHYPGPEKVKELLAKLIDKINRYTLQNSSKTSKYQSMKSTNDLKFAILIQRELAAIHPFQDGNGRISRFLMDYITIKLDLPFLFIPDMNNDYSASFETYYSWVLDGIKETNSIIQDCIQRYQSKEKNIEDSNCGFLKTLDINRS